MVEFLYLYIFLRVLWPCLFLIILLSSFYRSKGLYKYLYVFITNFKSILISFSIWMITLLFLLFIFVDAHWNFSFFDYHWNYNLLIFLSVFFITMTIIYVIHYKLMLYFTKYNIEFVKHIIKIQSRLLIIILPIAIILYVLSLDIWWVQ